MLPFLHHQRQELDGLLTSCAAALRAHTDSSADLEQLLTGLLDATAGTYHSFGASDRESQTLLLRAQVEEAHRGVNPLTLERPGTHRREMQRGAALHALRTLSTYLQEDYRRADAEVADLRTNPRPLALYVLQQDLLSAAEDLTQEAVERVWKQLVEDPNTQPVVRQVQMSFAAPDVVLTMADLLLSAH